MLLSAHRNNTSCLSKFFLLKANVFASSFLFYLSFGRPAWGTIDLVTRIWIHLSYFFFFLQINLKKYVFFFNSMNIFCIRLLFNYTLIVTKGNSMATIWYICMLSLCVNFIHWIEDNKWCHLERIIDLVYHNNKTKLKWALDLNFLRARLEYNFKVGVFKQRNTWNTSQLMVS